MAEAEKSRTYTMREHDALPAAGCEQDCAGGMQPTGPTEGIDLLGLVHKLQASLLTWADELQLDSMWENWATDSMEPNECADCLQMTIATDSRRLASVAAVAWGRATADDLTSRYEELYQSAIEYEELLKALEAEAEEGIEGLQEEFACKVGEEEATKRMEEYLTESSKAAAKVFCEKLDALGPEAARRWRAEQEPRLAVPM